MPNADIYVASYDEMGKAAAKLQSYSESYTEIYTKLLQNAQTMGVAWEGADNQAFVEQITGFTEELKYMAQRLAEDSKTLDTMKNNYANRQDTNMTQVKKLQN